jgi:membrane protein YdbS with pleckstrin-like domain
MDYQSDTGLPQTDKEGTQESAKMDETVKGDAFKEAVPGGATIEEAPSGGAAIKIFQKLDPRIITSWRITRWIRFGVFAVFLTVPTILLGLQDFFGEIAPFVLPFDAMVGIYLLTTLFFYPLIEYRQWGYIITEDRVEIRHGIFFIQTTIVPIIRIQHVTLSQGPINRKLGISTIEINTASGAFKIEGLSEKDATAIAESLKSKLLHRMKHNGNK